MLSCGRCAGSFGEVMYYVYILRCADNSLYTGVAADIERRMSEHFGQTERCAKYTRSHKAEKIEAVWETENRSLAQKLEYRIKRLTRAEKLRLIAGEMSVEDVVGEISEKYIMIKN